MTSLQCRLMSYVKGSHQQAEGAGLYNFTILHFCQPQGHQSLAFAAVHPSNWTAAPPASAASPPCSPENCCLPHRVASTTPACHFCCVTLADVRTTLAATSMAPPAMPAMLPNRSNGRHFTPQSCSAATSSSTSALLCPAERLTRSREVPWGTVGGRMAGTWKPLASS